VRVGRVGEIFARISRGYYVENGPVEFKLKGKGKLFPISLNSAANQRRIGRQATRLAWE